MAGYYGDGELVQCEESNVLSRETLSHSSLLPERPVRSLPRLSERSR
jgi:hypothetical protein